MATFNRAPIQNDYTRLAGRMHDRSTGIPRLYLGPNHLLILKLKNRREIARRFYYDDITALRCLPTRWGYVIDVTFWIVAALLWVNSLAQANAGPGTYVLAVTATIIAVVAQLANWYRGPTCRTWLHTTNHTERLSGLGRYNTARRALARIHERIVEGQMARDADMLAVDLVFEPAAPTPVPVSVSEIEPSCRKHDPRMMKVAFSLALCGVLLACLEFFYGNDGTTALGLWLAIGATIVQLTALIRSYDTNCPWAARRMCAWLLASTTLSIPITIAAMIFLAVNGVDALSVESIRDVHPSDGLQYAVMVGLHLGMILFDSTCAITGLVVLNRSTPRAANPLQGISEM